MKNTYKVYTYKIWYVPHIASHLNDFLDFSSIYIIFNALQLILGQDNTFRFMSKYFVYKSTTKIPMHSWKI